MRILFIVLITLACGAFVGWLLQLGAGELTLAYGEWIVRANLSVAALALLFTLLLGYLVVWLAMRLLRLPAGLRRWRERRRSRNSERLLTRGLLAMLEDNWPAAERAFRKSASCSRTPAINYLGAALAAERQGEQRRSEACLRLAERHDQTGSPALALAQARLQVNRQPPEQAHETLRALCREQPDNDKLKLMLLETAMATRDWQEAAGLLQECERKRLLSADQAQAKRRALHAARLRQAGAGQDCADLDAVWRAIPNRHRQDPELLRVYVAERLRYPDNAHCEALLRQTLKKRWEPGLARLYGLVTGKNPKRQLDFAERRLTRRPDDPALLLALGRLCRKNQLWGKARTYLERSMEAGPDPEACQELAGLLEEQGDQAGATRYYQLALSQDSQP